MIAGILGSLRWSLSLAAKFSRVALWSTSLIVLLTLVSQISMLLASFLPLKVVILLGSERIPRYFPEALASMDQNVLIATLSVATVGFFVLYLLAERLITLVTDQATRLLLAKSHKMVLFENQDETAASAYQRFSRTLAGGVFVVLALIGLFVFYPEMGGVVLGYVVMAAFVLWALGTRSEGFRERLETRLSQTMTLTGGIGFFIAFAYLVADFILLVPPGLIVAIVSLLLSRQLLGRLATIAQDISSLHAQRVKIDALFFHGKVLLPQPVREDKTIWPLLEPGSRGDWVSGMLEELVNDWQGLERIEWHPSGVHDVAALRVVGKSATEDQYLVKLFEANRKSLGLHESTLLSEPPRELPGPGFLGSTKVGRFLCVAYALPAGGPAVGMTRELRPMMQEIRVHLLSVEPQTGLVQRYQRSRAVLWQRIEPTLLKRLSVAASSEEQLRYVDLILEKLPALQLHLKDLPVAIVNPEMRPVDVWVEARTGNPILLNWGRWGLEPVGSGWTVDAVLSQGKGGEERLCDALARAAETRPSLSGIRPEAAELAALVSALEKHCLMQQFVEALELLPRIFQCLASLDDA